MPAVQAKGLEDRAFYRYGRLVALNEVGGNPGEFGEPVEVFHQRLVERARTHPHRMLSTANVSDGLDREAGEGLAEEMERLHKSCRMLVWLNPLLRYEKFEARPAGVRAMLPHVDLFLPVHNLRSLVDLARTLSAPMRRTGQERLAWK